MTAVEREARDALRRALAADRGEVHDALLRLVKADNPQAVIYAHQQIYGKPKERIEVDDKRNNPYDDVPAEQLIAMLDRINALDS